MGGLVQQSPPPRAYRQRPTRRGRGPLPRRTGEPRRGRVRLKRNNLRETRSGSLADFGDTPASALTSAVTCFEWVLRFREAGHEDYRNADARRLLARVAEKLGVLGR